MLERIPNIFKRERRRDVIEKGTDSQHFVTAVQRMVLLLDEMEEALGEHPWLASDHYTLADVAFTPYLARLEHLNILGLADERPRVADWYGRCKRRPNFHQAIVKWENADYLKLMQRRGGEAWPHVQHIMRMPTTAVTAGAPPAAQGSGPGRISGQNTFFAKSPR
jgi:hypothetical protein